MRTRDLRPGFFKNEELAEIEPLGRILFSGLWCMADREGRLEDRPKKIKIEVLPYDNCDIESLLTSLVIHNFINRYKVEEKHFIQILHFKDNQNIHPNEAKSIIPPAQVNIVTCNVKAVTFSGEEVATRVITPITSFPSLSSCTSIPAVVVSDNTNVTSGEAENQPAATTATEEVVELGKRPYKPEEFQQVYNVYKTCIAGWSDTIRNRIVDWLADVEPEVLLLAIDQAVCAGVRNWRYINGILRRWFDDGVRTGTQAELHIQEHLDQKKTSGNNRASPPTRAELIHRFRDTLMDKLGVIEFEKFPGGPGCKCKGHGTIVDGDRRYICPHTEIDEIINKGG